MGTETETAAFEGWAIVELMGHVRVAGYVTETSFAGAKVGRIEIPNATPDDKPVTQFFGGAALFRMTPTTEEIARRVAAANKPQPVHAWEMRQLPAPGEVEDADTSPDDGDSQDDNDDVF